MLHIAKIINGARLRLAAFLAPVYQDASFKLHIANPVPGFRNGLLP